MATSVEKNSASFSGKFSSWSRTLNDYVAKRYYSKAMSRVHVSCEARFEYFIFVDQQKCRPANVSSKVYLYFIGINEGFQCSTKGWSMKGE